MQGNNKVLNFKKPTDNNTPAFRLDSNKHKNYRHNLYTMYVYSNIRILLFQIYELGVGVGSGPAAHGVDAEVLVVHVDAEEAALAPVRAPGVAADPVLDATRLVNTPTSDHDDVVGGMILTLFVLLLVTENDAAVISIELSGLRVQVT